MPAAIRITEQLSPGEISAILSEAEALSARSHREALPEQAIHRLGDPGGIHLIGGAPEEGAARHQGLRYAQCTVVSGALECWTLGDRIDSEMLRAIEGAAAERSLGARIWRRASLPKDPPIDAMSLEREIIRMDRDLSDLPIAEHADPVVIRSFEPGRDDEAWLALNARAFADHPEQGQVDERGLEIRKGQPWFDARGFLLLELRGTIEAFCWTKVHREDPLGSLGEIYAIGVDPDRSGRGLGRSIVLAGLDHLRAIGISSAFLYVESDNAAALQLYRSLGFTESWRDQLWAT